MHFRLEFNLRFCGLFKDFVESWCYDQINLLSAYIYFSTSEYFRSDKRSYSLGLLTFQSRQKLDALWWFLWFAQCAMQSFRLIFSAENNRKRSVPIKLFPLKVFQLLLSLIVGSIHEVYKILRNILVIANFFLFNGINWRIHSDITLTALVLFWFSTIRPLWILF